ncbi:MAG: dTMP kinase [Calditrichaeota bacterium]|nr:dTMP kinase [Calditrichota bacterium]
MINVGKESRGKFVTFEGIDASGKSVQAKLLYQRLQNNGVDSVLLRDPGATRISERVRDILLDNAHEEMSPWAELLLYEAARAQMVEETIFPALADGKVVICDRFYDSTTAYQGYGRSLDLNLVKQANTIGSIGLVPDLTFLIDLDPHVAIERMKKSNRANDRMESAGIELQKRVFDGYRKVAALEPERFSVISGDQEIKVIEKIIWNIFKNKFEWFFSLATGKEDR